MESECMLSADLDGCYYVSPAYSRTARQSHSSSADNSCSSSSSNVSSSGSDRSRLAALIKEFNTNNHGLMMTLVSVITVLFIMILVLCVQAALSHNTQFHYRRLCWV